MSIPWMSLLSARGAGSALLVENQEGLVEEISATARKARLFPIRVALEGTADFDLAYFLLATECLVDLGFTSPQPIMNIDLYMELLGEAELPGETGQVFMLDNIDGIASEPSPSLNVFIDVLWDLFDTRRRVAAYTGELKVVHWVLIGDRPALNVADRALHGFNLQISESPIPRVREMHKPIPVAWVGHGPGRSRPSMEG